MLFCKCLQECPSVWGRCRRHTLWRAPACGCLLAHPLSSCAGTVAAQAVSAGRVSTHRACLVRGSESASCTCLQGHFVLRGAGHRQDTDGEGAGGVNRPALAQAGGALLAQGRRLPRQVQRGGRAHPAPAVRRGAPAVCSSALARGAYASQSSVMACDHAHTCCSLPLLRLEVSPRRGACCRLHPGRPCFSARPQGCAVLLQAAARAPSIVFPR